MRLFRFVFLLLFATNVHAQKYHIEAFVEERTELLGIVFRLAGADEFTNNRLKSYSSDIDQYFEIYKNHEAIRMAKLLRSTCGISYDAVMSLAVNIEIGDEVKLYGDIKNASLDSRWIMSDAKRFVRALNSFYKDSDFKTFFNDHKPLYDVANENFTYLFKRFEADWFGEYFGRESSDSFDVIIGLTHTGSFGVQTVLNSGKRNLYAVIGTYQTDSLGNPQYKSNMLGVIVHEFCHSFCNQIIDRHYNDMRKKSKTFFAMERKVLELNAYNSDIVMLYETLVRSCVIRYYKSINASEADIKQMIAQERNSGFLWIESLINQLDIYEKNRAEYATLDDFMPQVVNNFNSLPVFKIKKDIVDKSSKIISTSIENGDKKVDPTTEQIMIVFSKPMSSKAFGLGTNPKGKGKMPKSSSQRVHWNKDNATELIIPVELEPNTKYSMVFHGHFFMTDDGYPLDRDYILTFKTSE